MSKGLRIFSLIVAIMMILGTGESLIFSIAYHPQHLGGVG